MAPEPAGKMEDSWERGWEGHELSQLRRLAALPLREKIAWLEKAQVLARRVKP